MLYWSLVFFIAAIISALFGFGDAAAPGGLELGRILFYLFTVLFVVAAIFGLVEERK